ncbi:histidine phosphatase family protein [Gordonia crocea]|uniref:Phosphoglycerate mutase n=1 Tax=Gordonia crocea TaxID=589162 RepID=A0A7M3STU0_9ACTN|nr:histidine phosphatase family protein [Gordonia crocea]GED96064.1 phosphoglycerate mutase [Gordonia crocea]
MGSLYLVRHGQAQASAYGATDEQGGSEPGSLTPIGDQQALLTGQTLAGVVAGFTSTISGSLTRQRQTLGGILQAFDDAPAATVDDGWDEYDLAGLLGAPTADQLADGRTFQQSLDGALAAWVRGELDAAVPFAAYAARVADAGRRAVAQAGSGKNVLVVSSAGSITLWLAQHLGIGVDQWPALARSMMNASITKTLVGRQGVTILSINEHLHLTDRDGGIATFR